MSESIRQASVLAASAAIDLAVIVAVSALLLALIIREIRRGK